MSHRESDRDCARLADAAAYALGALEQDELAPYREHLEDCAQCRAEVAELQGVVDELPKSVPAASAPAALRGRILANVRAEAVLLNAAGHTADEPSKSSRPWYRRNDFMLGAGAAAAAGLAALIAVLIAVGSSSHGRVTVIPGKGIGVARTAEVSLKRDNGRAELVVAHMPPPALGRIYEVWLVHKTGAPRPTNSLFSVTSGGSGEVDVPNSLHGVKEVLVTSEPAGGSLHPTRPPVIAVALTAT
ncbi:MAG TPA: anti-sigma factor [Solirubrobacteraceae bacterium]|nr:anti-sigma factor [Solirubrobacteraceae bacterium]